MTEGNNLHIPYYTLLFALLWSTELFTFNFRNVKKLGNSLYLNNDKLCILHFLIFSFPKQANSNFNYKNKM